MYDSDPYLRDLRKFGFSGEAKVGEAKGLFSTTENGYYNCDCGLLEAVWFKAA